MEKEDRDKIDNLLTELALKMSESVENYGIKAMALKLKLSQNIETIFNNIEPLEEEGIGKEAYCFFEQLNVLAENFINEYINKEK